MTGAHVRTSAGARSRRSTAGQRSGRLELREVEVRHGERVALRPVTFDLEPGSSLAVTGPAGGGKSTLIWALAGATAYSGSVRFAGEPVVHRDAAAALGIAVVPQGNGLASALTAEENVVLPAVSLGVDYADAVRRARDALTLVGLEESEQHLVEELSGGQQQRVAVARALALHPAVLLADEPTSDLDSTTRTRVVTALLDRARAGTIVVTTTNDPEVAALFDAHAELDEGRLRWIRR